MLQRICMFFCLPERNVITSTSSKLGTQLMQSSESKTSTSNTSSIDDVQINPYGFDKRGVRHHELNPYSWFECEHCGEHHYLGDLHELKKKAKQANEEPDPTKLCLQASEKEREERQWKDIQTQFQQRERESESDSKY